MSWDQQFSDPIFLPGRKPLLTLRDAAIYITELPKAEHDAQEWQTAMEALPGSYILVQAIMSAMDDGNPTGTSHGPKGLEHFPESVRRVRLQQS